MRIALLALLLVACGSEDSSSNGGTSQGGTGGSPGGTGGSGGSGNGGAGGSSGGGGASGASGGSGGSAGGNGGSGGNGAAIGSGALHFVQNAANAHEYARHTVIPGTFGAAEFTLEVWITLQNGPSGACTDGTTAQLANWCTADNAPYTSSSWWYEGNFLLDGHNNSSFGDGTFSLQLYGTGRIRWLFGDGAVNEAGGVWSVGAYPSTNTPTLLDQQPHLITAVRRFTGATSSSLELWVDGVLVTSQLSPARPNLRQWWNDWAGFPSGQSGWFWGAEKQAAIGVLPQYEDFKGWLHQVRFWSVARSPSEIAASPSAPISAGASGLVGLFDFSEGSGTQACDDLSAACMTVHNATASIWAP